MLDERCKVASVLPEYLQKALPYEFLNRMQSECLEAWTSDANLLISAPTGSGKTLCFELALLRLLHSRLEASKTTHLGPGGLGGKVVFVAPTKALCAERAQDWKVRYEFVGLQVEIATGDVRASASDKRLERADLIVTTPEKWDSLTRNVDRQSSADLTWQVSLLLLDEVHLLGETRGATFEAVVTRMLAVGDECKCRNPSEKTMPIASLRVVAVSATVANVHDIGAWLRIPPTYIKEFDVSYRPIPLQYVVLPCYVRNPWESGRVYDGQILSVLQRYRSEKPALIFCPSRQQSALSAESLVAKLNAINVNTIEHGNAVTKALSLEQRRELSTRAQQCSDRVLARLLPNGVAIHNAEMKPHSRNIVEQLFRKSLIQCLFATSTLAQGVNLPVRLVVVAGTAVYRNGSLQEYDRNMLMQMCGRAGRPGLDTKGIATIMTTKSNARLYENMNCKPQGTIESRLSCNLNESINAEIARQFITDIPSAVSFLSNTFFWIREQRLRKVDFDNNKSNRTATITSTSVNAMQALCDLGLIRFDEDGFGVESTLGGKATAKYCISCNTVRSLRENIPNVTSPAQVLRIIAATSEVAENICLRRNEKRSLNKANGFVRFPIQGKVKDETDKVVILFQMVLGDLINSSWFDFSLQSEATRLMDSASRVSSYLISLTLDLYTNAPYEAVFAVLQVCRGLLSRTFWDGPTVLKQVSGIGAMETKALVKAGVANISSLSKLDSESIDKIVNSPVPIGKKILTKLEEFPRLHLQTAVQKRSNGEIASIRVRVVLSAQIGHRPPRYRKGERGFVLIGSHSVGVLYLKTFCLSTSDQEFHFPINIGATTRRERWIDVCLGCESVIGIDETKRLIIGGRLTDNVTLTQSGSETSEQHIGSSQFRQKRSVTGGRVSKRLVQRSVVQALTRGFTSRAKGKSTDGPRSFVRNAGVNKLLGSAQKLEVPRQDEVELMRATRPLSNALLLSLENEKGSAPRHDVLVPPSTAHPPSLICGKASSHAQVLPSPPVSGQQRQKLSSKKQTTLAVIDNTLASCAPRKPELPPAQPSPSEDLTGREYDDVFRNLF